jgi:hypothetical protein
MYVSFALKVICINHFDRFLRGFLPDDFPAARKMAPPCCARAWLMLVRSSSLKHIVTTKWIQEWLEDGAKLPKEAMMKKRLRALL